MKNIDYQGTLGKLMDTVFLRYEGCLITKEKVGFTWDGIHYDTEEEVKAEIDKTRTTIGNSIKK